MTRKCNLMVDSCCELPPAMLAYDGLYVMNYIYTLDGEVHMDDLYQSISAHEFFESMREGAQPQTSQIPMQMITDMFSTVMQTGIPTVYLSFSGALTGTVDTAHVLYESLHADHPDWGEVFIFDTKLASTAEALLVLEAIRQWEKGLSAQEMLDWAENAAPHVNEMFVVDDLAALRRGGRIPGAVAAIGSKLDVKPLLDIAVEDGSLRSCGLARGKKKAIKQMVGLFTKLIPESDRDGRVVIIGDADCPEDAKRLEDMVRKTSSGIQIIRHSIGPVIGSHVGPGMLSIVFWGPDSRK